jgi:hypothetical protein
MENILENGFFWGLLCIAFISIAVYLSNRTEKTNKKPAQA